MSTMIVTIEHKNGQRTHVESPVGDNTTASAEFMRAVDAGGAVRFFDPEGRTLVMLDRWVGVKSEKVIVLW